MPKFHIEKLVVTGSGKEPSVIDFCSGLNLIVGPSNTGKSYVLECIDYLFGFEEKKNKPGNWIRPKFQFLAQIITLNMVNTPQALREKNVSGRSGFK